MFLHFSGTTEIASIRQYNPLTVESSGLCICVTIEVTDTFASKYP